jgi:hypothetical protein
VCVVALIYAATRRTRSVVQCVYNMGYIKQDVTHFALSYHAIETLQHSAACDSDALKKCGASSIFILRSDFQSARAVGL